MNAKATMTFAIIVKIKGKRLSLLSVQRLLNSSLRKFFITIERRNGDIIKTVNVPQTALPVNGQTNADSTEAQT